jgi:hypothetical protein
MNDTKPGRGGSRTGAGRKSTPKGRRQQELSPAAAAHLRALATAHYGHTPSKAEEAAYLSGLVMLTLPL